MDKLNKPGSNASTTSERLKAMRAKEEQDKNEFIENYEEYKRALNAIANTEYGAHVLKIWIKAFGVFAVKPSRDGAALVSDKVLREFYLTMIRPHLDTSLRRQLED